MHFLADLVLFFLIQSNEPSPRTILTRPLTTRMKRSKSDLLCDHIRSPTSSWLRDRTVLPSSRTGRNHRVDHMVPHPSSEPCQRQTKADSSESLLTMTSLFPPSWAHQSICEEWLRAS